MLTNSKMNTETKKEFLKKYKTDDVASHTFLDGGKLYIPIEKLKGVYKKLSQNLTNPPLCERIGVYGDEFKFFIDVDDKTIDINKIVRITNKL